MKIFLKDSIRMMLVLMAVGAVFFTNVHSAYAFVRIKEIAQFDGARDNQLVGYGIVVGLSGTGDKKKSVFTFKSIAKMLQRLGTKVESRDIDQVKNTAAVMVTATLPPFVKNGTKIDVTLSSLGDAKSLAGGVLVQTPLQGPDGIVYAVAQGPISVGGAAAGGKGKVTTVATIPNGAIVEKEVPVTMLKGGELSLSLFQNDFTTSARVAEAINLEFGQVLAYAVDGGTIKIKVPALFKNDLVKFVSKVERTEVVPDYKAKIVINERTGTIVGGKDAKIAKVSLAHNNLHIEIEPLKKAESIKEDPTPAVESLGDYHNALFREDVKDISSFEEGEITVGELAQHLNSLGVQAKDMIAILQSIKAANAINAEIVII